MPLSLAEIFHQRAEEQPGHHVILGPSPKTCMTYGDLQNDIQQLAKKLQAAGVGKGMNIGLHYPSGTDYITLTYALWDSEAAVTPIPMELADEEKQRILTHISIDAVINSPSPLQIIATVNSLPLKYSSINAGCLYCL